MPWQPCPGIAPEAVSPGVAPLVGGLQAMANAGWDALGVAHDVDCVRQVAVHLRHTVAIACMLLHPAQSKHPCAGQDCG